MKKFFGMLTKQFVEFVVLRLHNTYIIVRNEAYSRLRTNNYLNSCCLSLEISM